MNTYFRPLVQYGPARPADARVLAGGWGWFNQVEVLRRDAPAQVRPAAVTPDDWLDRLTAPRAPVAGVTLDLPRIMGILNATPDSFSDGGAYQSVTAELGHARTMVDAGAAILDIGGESTRPGAREVPVAEEINRVQPLFAALRAQGIAVPLSLDTRKAAVAQAVAADLINDVSGFTFDPSLAPLAARKGLPVCVMHCKGLPETMHLDPTYDDVVLDVFDALRARIEALEAVGVPRAHILADPGIGFGKSAAHNLALLARLSLFHGLGTGLLLGVSRKGFIGRIGIAPMPEDRLPGSVAVGLHAVAQGVQVLRVHDVAAHAQALALWRACMA